MQTGKGKKKEQEKADQAGFVRTFTGGQHFVCTGGGGR